MIQKTPIHLGLWIAAFWILFNACTPPDPNKQSQSLMVNLDLSNKAVQHIYNLRDQNLTDSLAKYFTHSNVTYRYLAALSFASVKDSAILEPLAKLLNDPSFEVREAAAFSLGLLGTSRAEKYLMAGFQNNDSLSKNQALNATIMESVGRCGTAANLKNLATIRTFLYTDTMLLLGQCRGMYRYGLRGISSPEATARLTTIIGDDKMPSEVRLMAAHTLGRTKDIALDSAQGAVLAAAFWRSATPEVRMAIAKALGKSVNAPAFSLIAKALTTERDWRVKCNLINALAKFEYDTSRAVIAPLLYDENPHVSLTVANFFVENGKPKDGEYYYRMARDNPGLPPLTMVALYRAANKVLSTKFYPETKDAVNFRLRDLYQQNQNPFVRAACLTALGEFGWQYRWIADKGMVDPHPGVKSACLEAISAIAQKPDFYSFFGEAARGVRREIYYILRQSIATGDVGMVAVASEAICSKTLNYKEMRDSARTDDLRATMSKLKIPRDVEASMALEKAIAYFEDKPEPKPMRPAFNHPIDWSLVTSVKQTTKAIIYTKKGQITLELMPEWAPGSVANFVKLASEGFYNSKLFHRVVPNFVVQGGCPRGDGYGSLDYSIRTEIGPVNYGKTGMVGMASAGKDTEGTQFFITHSPAPHLDGNYTIFARVTDGMDVVNQLQMGDVMDKIEIKF